MSIQHQLQFLGLPVQKGDDLKKHLFNHGYGTITAVRNIKGEQTWVLDSLGYLSRSHAVVGLLTKIRDKDGEASWRGIRVGKECTWNTEIGTETKNSYDTVEECRTESEATYCIWKMWVPIARALQFGAGADIHITTTAMAETERLELEQTSAYMPLLSNYKDSKACVLAQMKKWQSDVLMSNRAGVVLCHPTKRGFRGEKLMSVEGLNPYRMAERMFETFVKKIQVAAECRIEEKVRIYNICAHALHAATKVISVEVKASDFSMFTPEELQILITNDKSLEAIAHTVQASEEKIERRAKEERRKEEQRHFERTSPKGKPSPVFHVNGPRDPLQLQKAREARKKRLEKLQKEVTQENVVVSENDSGVLSNLMLL